MADFNANIEKRELSKLDRAVKGFGSEFRRICSECPEVTHTGITDQSTLSDEVRREFSEPPQLELAPDVGIRRGFSEHPSLSLPPGVDFGVAIEMFSLQPGDFLVLHAPDDMSYEQVRLASAIFEAAVKKACSGASGVTVIGDTSIEHLPAEQVTHWLERVRAASTPKPACPRGCVSDSGVRRCMDGCPCGCHVKA